MQPCPPHLRRAGPPQGQQGKLLCAKGKADQPAERKGGKTKFKKHDRVMHNFMLTFEDGHVRYQYYVGTVICLKREPSASLLYVVKFDDEPENEYKLKASELEKPDASKSPIGKL